jgi:hypothetical protein
MKQRKSAHRGYMLHTEFGDWVAYRSKDFVKMPLINYPTDMDRVVLGTPDLEEAKKRLDRYLSKSSG